MGSLKTVGWVGGDYLGPEKVSFIKHRVQKSYLIYDQMASIDTLFMATTSENPNCVFLYSPYKEYLPPPVWRAVEKQKSHSQQHDRTIANCSFTDDLLTLVTSRA